MWLIEPKKKKPDSDAGPGSRCSALAKVLLEGYFHGELSARFLQKIAGAALADGLDIQEIEKLASLGTRGMHTGHIARDLTGNLGKSFLEDALGVVHLRTLDQKRVVQAGYMAFLPHRVFWAMHQHSESVFQEFWGADPGPLGKFWRALPASSRPAPHLQEWTIPCKFFGDGVACLGLNRTWGKSVHAYLLAPMLGDTPNRVRQILISALWKSRLTTQGERDWWSVVAWSLQALHDGRWPEKDFRGNEFAPDSLEAKYRGRDLAAGWRGRVLCLSADLEFVASGLGLQNPNSLEPCSKCKANSSTIPWTDGRAGALWRRTGGLLVDSNSGIFLT